MAILALGAIAASVHFTRQGHLAGMFGSWFAVLACIIAVPPDGWRKGGGAAARSVFGGLRMLWGWRLPLLLASCGALAYGFFLMQPAQAGDANPRNFPVGFTLYFAAVAALALALPWTRRSDEAVPEAAGHGGAHEGAAARFQPLTVLLLAGAAACIVLAGLAFQAAPPRGALSSKAMLYTIAAAVLLLASARPSRARAAAESSVTPPLSKGIEIPIVLAILGLGLFLRLWKVSVFPPGLYQDEALPALDAQSLMDGKIKTPFWHMWGALPGLMYYLDIIFLKLFGQTQEALRYLYVVVGMLNLAAFYGVARLLIPVRPAILALGLFAVAHHHIHNSRVIMALGIHIVLFTALTYYFLLRGMASGRKLHYVLGGLALGLCGYLYLASRLFPAALAATAGYLLIYRARFLFAKLWGLTIAAIVGGLVAAPWMYHLLSTKDLWRSVGTVSVNPGESPFVWAKALPPGLPWTLDGIGGAVAAIAANLRDCTLMYVSRHGDAPFTSLPGYPLLDPVMSGLLAVGIVLALVRFVLPFLAPASAGSAPGVLPRGGREALIFLWFLVGMAPSFLANAWPPQSRRQFMALGAVFLLMGLTLESLWVMSRTALGPLRKVVGFAVAAIAFGFCLKYNLWTYHTLHFNHQEAWDWFCSTRYKVGLELGKLGASVRTYGPPVMVYHPAVEFLAHGSGAQTRYFDASEHLPYFGPADRGVLYCFNGDEIENVAVAKAYYPEAKTRDYDDRWNRLSPGETARMVEIPREAIQDRQGLTARYEGGGRSVDARVNEAMIEFGATPPIPYPFRGTWSGTMLVPGFGEYQFLLTGTGDGVAELDGKVVARMVNGRGEPFPVKLSKGRHLIRVRGSFPQAPGRLALEWESRWVRHDPYITLAKQIVPSTALLRGEFGHGVREIVYSGREHKGEIWEERVWPVLYYQRGVNPKPTFPFAVEWRAELTAPVDGRYAFEVLCNYASTFSLDGRLVVGRLENERGTGFADLKAGPHRLVLQSQASVEFLNVGLYWTVPGGTRQLVPHERLRPLDSGP